MIKSLKCLPLDILMQSDWTDPVRSFHRCTNFSNSTSLNHHTHYMPQTQISIPQNKHITTDTWQHLAWVTHDGHLVRHTLQVPGINQMIKYWLKKNTLHSFMNILIQSADEDARQPGRRSWESMKSSKIYVMPSMSPKHTIPGIPTWNSLLCDPSLTLTLQIQMKSICPCISRLGYFVKP